MEEDTFIDIAPILRKHVCKSSDTASILVSSIIRVIENEGKVFVNKDNIVTCQIKENTCYISIGCGDWFNTIHDKVVEYAKLNGVKKLVWGSERKGMERKLKQMKSTAFVTARRFEEKI